MQENNSGVFFLNSIVSFINITYFSLDESGILTNTQADRRPSPEDIAQKFHALHLSWNTKNPELTELATKLYTNEFHFWVLHSVHGTVWKLNYASILTSIGGPNGVAGWQLPPVPSILLPASCQDDNAVCPLSSFKSREANRILV